MLKFYFAPFFLQLNLGGRIFFKDAHFCTSFSLTVELGGTFMSEDARLCSLYFLTAEKRVGDKLCGRKRSQGLRPKYISAL
jgi:hypothetical protein